MSPLQHVDEMSVHELFELRARECPDATALRYGAQRVSYGELEARANRLAHWLIGAGVGPETLVGLCFRPSISAVVATLGVLKAGGAFLPLDVSYPLSHVRRILASSGAQLVLADPSLTGAVPPGAALAVGLDEGASNIASQPSGAVAPRAGFSALAYELYTSGSTGEPKGVMIEHRSLANTIVGLCDVYGMGPSDRVLQFAPLGFDVSIEELFISLASGATLVGGEEARAGSLRHFLSSCTEQQVTVLELPTAFWHVLVDFLATSDCPLPSSVRLVVIGSEAARPDCVRRWAELARRRPGMPRLVNAYGLTETTITSHVGELTTTGTAPSSDHISIGWPIAGVTQTVLDATGRPVEHGQTGELHIGGRAVARGYRTPSELDGNRFLAPTEAGGEAGPTFRTGDLVRERPDGALDFVGRADSQLKIRSFRVEPAQVERAVEAHPGVSQVVVGQREGQDTLVAWIVPDGKSVTLSELQRHLRSKLPEYMVPAELAILAALPVLPNGKVDRRSLARSSATPALVARVAPAVATVAGNDVDRPVEAVLMAIWEEVLGVRPASSNDDFIALGGHSLRATQLLARIRERFGTEVTFGQFMRHPTVAGLAQLVGAVRPEAAAGAPRC